MYRLGIDIGGTKINIGILDENNNIIEKKAQNLPEDKCPESAAETVCNILNCFNSDNLKKAAAAGVGVPGTVSADGRIAKKVPNMGWNNVPFADILEKKINIPVVLIQDSRACAYGEYMVGAGRGKNVLVSVTLGTGIGTGIVINGKIFNGALGTAGELGHLPSGDEGRKCGCGKEDCLECYSAGKGIEISAQKEFGQKKTCSEVFDMANSGDEKAIAIIDDAVMKLGKAMVSVLNLLSPDALIFSGGISAQKKLYVDPLIEYIKKHCYASENKMPEIDVSRLGADAPMIGAALVPQLKNIRKKCISVSMMCANMLNLYNEVKKMEEEGIDYLHFDVMDGHFVPNLMIPSEMINQIRNVTDIPFDLHLMVENPENYIGMYNLKENDFVSVHYESTKHVQRALSMIKQKGAKAALAINPGTPIECTRDLLEDIGMILVMTVNPGFAGQKLVAQCIGKITRLRNYLDSLGYENIKIEVDGNCSFENIPKMLNAGADIFVAGTSSIFDKTLGMEKAMEKLRKIYK